MNWLEFQHEAMATTFVIFIADQPADYARQAAAAAWRELDRLETELSRYVESSDIAQCNRLGRGESIALGESAFDCLLLSAGYSVATQGAFNVAYATQDLAPDSPPFTLDPENHMLTSRAARLHLDLGAVGKGYALDRMATLFQEWQIPSACLQSGGSTALALAAPSGSRGWPIGVGEADHRRVISLCRAALSGSGIAVKGTHLIDPRTGSAAARTNRTWAFAPSAALADALSTAFFVFSNIEITEFCRTNPKIGAAIAGAGGVIETMGLFPS